MKIRPLPSKITVWRCTLAAQGPILGGAGNLTIDQPIGAAVTVNGAVTVSDPGSTTLNGATIAITFGFLTGDMLNFTTQAGIAGNYDSNTGVLTLSGTASLAAYQSALDSITNSSISADPTEGGQTSPARSPGRR